MELTTEAIVLFVLIAALMLVLYKNWLKPAVAFIVLTVVLLALKILSPAEALQGFANEQLAVIILLLIISSTLEKTHVVDRIFKVVFNQSLSPQHFLFRMVALVGGASAFLNNTPLVAMMMPYVNTWGKQKHVSPSKLLIPLSYASILGGCVTLIGTSTNLIVNGLAVESGAPALDIFDFAWVGLPALLLGIIFLVTIGYRMLPSRKSTIEQISEREFLVETLVKAGSPLINKTVESGGLRSMEGLYLAEVHRGDHVFRPASPDLVLRQEDCLFFVGNTESIAELTKPNLGLSLPKPGSVTMEESNQLVEVIISQNSRLAGVRVQDSNFRARYDGAILAIHRNGENLKGKIGDIVLLEGDVLMVLAGGDFLTRIRNNPHFYLLSQIKEIHNIHLWKVALLIGGLLLAIVLSVFNMVPLFISLVVLLCALVLTRVAKPNEIRNSIDFNLALIIALGLALGKAMINTGAAAFLATGFMSLTDGSGPVLMLAAIFIFNNLLTSFMTSKAAVAITLPIALTMANIQGLPLEPFILVVAFSGAANFITPIGYQTNLMVYGPGGYTFRDFFRIGLPLTLIYFVVTIIGLALTYSLF